MWAVAQLSKLIKLRPELHKRLLELLKNDKELLRSIVIGAYIDGEISLGKAAELLGKTRDELIEEFKKLGIPIRKLSKEDVIAEVKAILSWEL